MTTSALIVVDMQNAFLDPSGGAPVPGAGAVVAAVNRWVGHADRRGWPIFYTRDVDPTGKSGPSAERDVALHPSVDVRGRVVDKGPGQRQGFSGFVLASAALPDGRAGGGGLSCLAGLLRSARVDEVVVVGVAADVCVSATARDARRLGYSVVVDLAASAFVHAHPAGDDAAVTDLQRAGIRVLTDQPRRSRR